MSVFEADDFSGHEKVAFFNDKESGLHSVIAIHSTALGPACGGVRMYPYADGRAALTDALRLSRGMSYKNAIADLPLGGGKAVIIGNPTHDKTEAKLLAFARAVDSLGGKYITAMDVGVTQDDMRVIARGTSHVAGYDQPGRTGGDSGPLTALGVFVGLKAAVKHRLGVDTTADLRIAIQGLGKVGMGLAERLHREGAHLIVADVNHDLARLAEESFQADIVAPDRIVTCECDVLSPNALGAILTDRSIEGLHARVVAGGANNQLARPENGDALRERGVLYAPDYVINGGGIIRVAGQIHGWSDADIEARVLRIGKTLDAIFARADSEGVATVTVADRIAEERMAAARPPAP
jgi:leucine dehydrogenase